MSYSTVMVHVDLDHANDARLQIAGRLAARFDATLIGVAAGEPGPTDHVEGAYLDARTARNRKALEERMINAEWRFRSVAERHVSDIGWRCALARPTDYLAQEARAADLLVTGTLQKGADFDPLSSPDPGDLAMKAGRPVLIIPPDVAWLQTRIMMVAWKDSREARRAIWDALPLLRCAQEVNVVAIPEGDADRADLRPQVDDVVSWLGRHGIAGFGMVPEPTESLAEQIAAIASELDADVVVAGAYSRARIAERIFGGVTQSILTRTTTCALLAH